MIDTAIDVIAKGAVEHAKDVAQDAMQQVQQLTGKQPKKRRMRASRIGLLLGLTGVVAIVVVMMRRRAVQPAAEPAPDLFGTAVEQERAAEAFGQPNVATPGA
jgi:hypothetical protein